MATDNGRKTQAIQLLGGVVAALVLVAVGWSIYSDIHAANLSQSADSSLVTNSSANSANTSATPFDVFDSHKPPLTELSAWAKSWQAGRATSRPSSVAELGNLKSLVENSGLSANYQLFIGTFILDKGDKDVAAVWYRSGINQTESEWNAAKKAHPDDSDSDIAELVIRPLLAKGLDAAGELFWEPGRVDGMSQLTLCNMELPLNRENEWDQRPEWMRVGHSEALCVLRRYDEALAEADALDKDAKTNTHWTDDQRAESEWNRAQILYQTGKMTEAIPHIKAIANNSAFHHSRSAWPMLARAYARAGQIELANNTFDEWVRRYKPDAAEAAPILTTIDKYTGRLPATQPDASASNLSEK